MSQNNSHHVSGYGMGKKTMKSYVTGLSLSIIFTLIAFTLVAAKSLSATGLYIALALLAILQLIAQVTCFLRMNASEEGKWNLMSFVFTVLIVLVLVAGSLWIMVNLNYNMMH